ncbi:MAG: Crp/Fnr family transcriptional regulator [Bacillota bacterium]
MKRVTDGALLKYYIAKYEINSIFANDLSHCMSLYKVERGEVICKTDDVLSHMFFNVKGKLKVYYMRENGKSLLLRFNKPLSVIGDVEFINRYSVKCCVEAITESLLIGVSFEDIKKYAYDDPVFLRYIISHLSHKLYTVSNASSMNVLYPLENRFASYLLSISSDENNSRISELKTNKLTEIANLLGSSYRHLSRVINELEEKKIIKNEKRQMIILDFNRLKELAGENIYE